MGLVIIGAEVYNKRSDNNFALHRRSRLSGLVHHDDNYDDAVHLVTCGVYGSDRFTGDSAVKQFARGCF